MHILVFNWRDIRNPRAGGAEIYTHEIAKRLVEAGHSVTLFTSAFPDCASGEQIDGVDILRDGGRIGVYFKAWRRYKREFKNKFDFVIDNVNTIPFFTPLYLKDPGAALIFQMTREVYRSVLPMGLSHVAMFVERLVLKFYKKSNIIVISDSIKEELVEEGFPANNISIVEPGLNHNDFSPGEKAARPTIIFMNRIVKYKNVAHLLKAFEIVCREVPAAFLMIGGCRGDSYEKVIKTQAEKSGLSGSIEFFAFAGKEEKTRLLQAAWVNVLPSVKEGWGMSVTEAAACGAPSIAYDVTGLRNAIVNNKTGFLVKYGDINELAARITELLSDKGLRDELGRNCIEHSRKSSWDTSAKLLLSIIATRRIDEVMGNR